MMTLDHVFDARRVIEPYVWRTPLVHSSALGHRSGAQVHLKPECWQPTGSFKVRGATFKLATLAEDQWARGLVTASAGNHGLGVAYASQRLGAPAPVIFVPENTPAPKLNRLSAFQCEVRREGADYDTAHALAEEYAHETGALYISAYDDPVVIAGQGTVGLEIMEALPDADLLLVPVGGGGLVAGIASAAKAIRPAVKIVGLQPEASPSAYLSLRDGHPYETYPAGPTICEGLAGGFGRLPFEVAAALIDEVIVVSEASIRRAVAWLLSCEQLVVEGSGAIAIAPLLDGALDCAGRKVVAVLTGRNLDPQLLREILAEKAAP
jgi:threonine dehydratase